MNITNFKNDYFPQLVKSTFINNYEYYKIDGGKDLSLKQYLNIITLPLPNLINKKKKETYNFKIHLSIDISFIFTDGTDEIYTLYVRSDAKKFKTDSYTSRITNKLTNSILKNYYELLTDNPGLTFDSILL